MLFIYLPTILFSRDDVSFYYRVSLCHKYKRRGEEERSERGEEMGGEGMEG